MANFKMFQTLEHENLNADVQADTHQMIAKGLSAEKLFAKFQDAVRNRPIVCQGKGQPDILPGV